MNKSKFYWVLLLILISGPDAVHSEAGEAPEHRLWQIVDAQTGVLRGYLLGTVHLPISTVTLASQLPKISDVLQSVTDFAFENPVATNSYLWDVQKFKKLKETESRLLEEEESGLGAGCQTRAPGARASQEKLSCRNSSSVIDNFQLNAQDSYNQLRLDIDLAMYARLYQKGVHELEEFELIELLSRAGRELDEFSKQYQPLPLLDKEENPFLVESIIQCYLKGDDCSIVLLLRGEELVDPVDKKRGQLWRSISKTRNHLWLRKIRSLLDDQEKTTLFAVGTAHLFGEEGLIELLRQEGYILKAVPLKQRPESISEDWPEYGRNYIWWIKTSLLWHLDTLAKIATEVILLTCSPF